MHKKNTSNLVLIFILEFLVYLGSKKKNQLIFFKKFNLEFFFYIREKKLMES